MKNLILVASILACISCLNSLGLNLPAEAIKINALTNEQQILSLLARLTVNFPSENASYTNEYWISPKVTGKFITNGISHQWTHRDPLDGSSYTNFDYNMNNVPPYSRIHLLPGTYQTLGDNTWGPKSGQQIIGSGIDVTIIQFPPDSVAVGLRDRSWLVHLLSPYMQTNILASDLTLDCNYQPGNIITLNGIGLNGSGNTIRNVKQINAAAFSSSMTNYEEAWGILIAATPGNKETYGNTIENCVISGFTCNNKNNLSALGFLQNNSGKILNNVIIQKTTNTVFGFYPGSHDSLVMGNTLTGVAVGSHYDDGTGVTNSLIISNKFINCIAAIDWANGKNRDDVIAFNEIILSSYDKRSCMAINLYSSPASYSNILVFGNNVRFNKEFSNYPAHFIIGYNQNCSGLTVQNNVVDPNLTNIFY